MENKENLISIPAEGNIQEPQIIEKTVLSESIERKDLSYIQEFLVSSARAEDIAKLSKEDKKKLAVLLVEFFDHPLRVDALQCIYEILNDSGAVEGVSQKLIERLTDFKKLVVLKGKIDYMKYTAKMNIEKEPENVYEDAN